MKFFKLNRVDGTVAAVLTLNDIISVNKTKDSVIVRYNNSPYEFVYEDISTKSVDELVDAVCAESNPIQPVLSPEPIDDPINNERLVFYTENRATMIQIHQIRAVVIDPTLDKTTIISYNGKTNTHVFNGDSERNDSYLQTELSQCVYRKTFRMNLQTGGAVYIDSCYLDNVEFEYHSDSNRYDVKLHICGEPTIQLTQIPFIGDEINEFISLLAK